MEQIFTQKEYEIASAIIKVALEKAAKSLEYFIKSEIKLELGGDFYVANDLSEDQITKKGGKVYLLSTNLIGDLQGVSYLLFSQEEVDLIMKARYPTKQFDAIKYQLKSASLILEIDNIITAGVMTELANSFKYKTYGAPPELRVLSHKEAAKLVTETTQNNEWILGFNTKLTGKTVNIKADFIWSVNSAFIEGVKKL